MFINTKLRTKLDSKSIFAYFVGYSLTSKAYRFWAPDTNKFFESVDYRIDESSKPYQSTSSFPNPSTTHVEHTVEFSTSRQTQLAHPIISTTDESTQHFDNANIPTSPVTNDL